MKLQSSRCALPILLIAAVLGATWLALAHDYKQLRVVVNQLDSANVPDLQQREKDMNDILRQCQKYGVYLQLTIEPLKTNQSPTRPDGTAIAPDGKVPNNGATIDLAKAANAELKTNGVKMWVAKEVRFGTNSAASSNKVVNGAAATGRSSGAVKEQSGVNGDQHTWLHEISHGLGLDDVGDTNNLMNRSRSVGGSPSGNGLTEAQCKELQKGADLRSPKTAKTKEQTNQPLAKTWSFRFYAPPVMTFFDQTPYDLEMAQVVIDHFLLNRTNRAVYIDTFVNASFEPPPLHVRYLVWLDLDNDLTTGDMQGFDAVIIQHLLTPTEGIAILQWLPAGASAPLEPLTAEPVRLFGTGETEGWEQVVGSVVHCIVPLDMLPGMGQVIRVRINSADETMEPYDVIEPEQMPTTPPPEPQLRLNVIETLPGQPVLVQGEMFTPNSPYRLIFNSTLMAEGVTGPAGEINTSFPAPELVPGDYLVDVIDAECQVQIAVLRMLDNQGLKIRFEGKELAISFRTHPGPTYIVEYKEDLGAPGPWMELQRINTTEAMVTLYDSPPVGQPRFYRWRQE